MQTELRPVIINRTRNVTAYEIETPPSVEGFDSGVEFSEWVTFDSGVPLSGSYGVEGAEGFLSHGGNLTCSVQFCSGNDTVLSTQTLWNINTLQPPVSYADGSSPDADLYVDPATDGEHIGPWHTFPSAMPAGSGYLMSASLFGADHGGGGLVLYPLSAMWNQPSRGTGVLTLELADSGCNILTTVDLLSFDYDCAPPTEDGPVAGHLHINPMSFQDEVISWSAPIQRARTRVVISDGENVRATGNFVGVVRRIY